MNTGGVSVPRVLVMVAFALSCFGLLMFLWLAFGGPIPLKPQGYRFKVAFDDATTLALQADVRSAGVTIGKVVETERAPAGNRLLATLELDSRFAPARSDARAILRQKTLLGETYVELDVGSQQAPILEEDSRLPDAAVVDTVEFDELLRIFDTETRRDFQRWQATLAEATEGRGRDFNSALGRFPGWGEQLRSVVDILDDRERNLSGLIRNTGVTFAALTRNEAALRRLIVRNRQVFDTLAGRREALAETFQLLPGFQRESRTTMRRVSRFAVDTEPLLRDLEPVLEDAQPTLASMRRLSPSLLRIFRDLDPLIDAGRTGFPALSRVLRGLDPTLAAVGPFLQQVNPILQFLEVYQASVSDFINVGPSALAGKRAVPEGSKSLGHVLPQLVVTGDQSMAQARRDDDNRGNSYNGPGALDGDGQRRDELINPNFDCAHIGGPRVDDEDDPGCFVQGPNPAGEPPFTAYPRIGPAPPGGR